MCNEGQPHIAMATALCPRGEYVGVGLYHINTRGRSQVSAEPPEGMSSFRVDYILWSCLASCTHAFLV